MRKTLQAAKKLVRILRDTFDDWLTVSAAIVCLMIIALVIFNMKSNLAEMYPLLGTLIFFLVPILFVAGGVIFIMAILKFSKQEETNEP